VQHRRQQNGTARLLVPDKEQSIRTAFGQAYLTTNFLSFAVQYLVFIVLLVPLCLFLWAATMCRGPIVFQRFAGWVATSRLRSILLGTLLMRIPSFYDLVRTGGLFLSTFQQKFWIDTLDPAAREALDRSCGRNLFLWDTLRIGDYSLARQISLDPTRARTTALDGWQIQGGQAANFANVPLFFNTGSPYHMQWRAAFWEYVVGARSVRAKLADGGRLAREQTRLIVDSWLAGGFDGIRPPMAAGTQYIVRPVFSMLMSILFDVHDPPDDLVEAATLFGTNGAMYWLLPPPYPPLFKAAGTLAPTKLKAFLFLHCNAAKPGSLLGRPVDWAGMADAIPGVDTVDARAAGRCGTAGGKCGASSCCAGGDGVLDNPKVDALLESVCIAVMLAGTAGTCTGTVNTLVKFVFFPRGPYMPKPLFNQPAWQHDAEQMAGLYRANPTSFLLETLRLACPVAGSHKVLDEPMTCPFLNKQTTFPKNTVVVANYNTAHLDPAEWGEDALAFRPGRAPADRYLIWNGPYGGDAPRKCPGEQLSTVIMTILFDAFVDEFFPPNGKPPRTAPNTAARGADLEGGLAPAAKPPAAPPARHPVFPLLYYALGGSRI
jgi:hypothetical protein